MLHVFVAVNCLYLINHQITTNIQRQALTTSPQVITTPANPPEPDESQRRHYNVVTITAPDFHLALGVVTLSYFDSVKIINLAYLIVANYQENIGHAGRQPLPLF